MEDDETKPGNYLALDGGLSGLSGLITLEELLSRLQFDLKLKEELAPWRHFRIIIGTGPGGLVAILIGKLKMTASEAIKAYTGLLPALSVPPAKDDEERRRNTEAFREAFLLVLKEAGYDSESPMLDDDSPKTVVVTSNVVNRMSHYFIRSYRVRGAPVPPCTILQVACACIASQERFLPVFIGEGHRKITLVDATAGYANPTKELMREAQSLFGEEADVSTILSLGAGNISIGPSFGSRRDELIEILNRGAVVCEQVHEDMQNRLSETSVYFRFNIEKEIEMSVESVSANTSSYLHGGLISKKLDQAAKTIYSRPSGIKLKDINSITAVEIRLKPRPSLVQNFVGREDILESMRRTHFSRRPSRLRSPVVTVLSGLGGSGKTQLTLRFALEFEERGIDIPVYLLNAESEASLKADFETLIRSFGLEHRSKSHSDALTWLATRLKNWLLILDNADNPDLPLFSYIPKSQFGSVVITTRNSNHASLAPNSHHHIEGLPDLDSVALVLQSSGYESTEENRAIAGEIVHELGNLPLALAQASGYILVHKCLSRYLDIYRESTVKILASSLSQRPEDYKLSVATTIQMSLDRLPPEAQNVMKLLAHLDSTSIPHGIISKAAKRRFEHVTWTKRSEFVPETLKHARALKSSFCNGGEWSSYDFNELITWCLQYSLLRITTQGDSIFYSMHILVQSYLKASWALIQGHRPGKLIARLLGSSFTYSADYKYLAFNRILLPHARLIQLGDVIEAGDHAGFGCGLDETGDRRLALVHWERCVEVWRASLGDGHGNTQGVMMALANSYAAVGRSQDALELDEQVLVLRRRLLGPEHQETMKAIHNLAGSYRKVGRKQEAMKMEEKVLEMRKRILGPEDPHTLRTMGNLATSYSGMGRIHDALKLDEQVLDSWRKVLGAEHPDTLRSMYNLAFSYNQLGLVEDAMKLEKQVVELRTKVLGLEHPDTAHAMWNWGHSLRNIRSRMRLLELSQNAVPMYERVWGLEDERTIWARKELAELLLELGGSSPQ